MGTIRCIKRYSFNDVASFGVRYHVKGGESYYCEASYSHLQEQSKDLGGNIDNIADREGTPESKKDSIIVSDDEAEDQLINVKIIVNVASGIALLNAVLFNSMR